MIYIKSSEGELHLNRCHFAPVQNGAHQNGGRPIDLRELDNSTTPFCVFNQHQNLFLCDSIRLESNAEVAFRERAFFA